MKALRDDIFIEPLPYDKEAYGKIDIIRNQQSQLAQGIVKSVGPLVKDIQENDKVLYNSFSASSLRDWVKVPSRYVLSKIVNVEKSTT